MRKIVLMTETDITTFDTKVILKQKLDDGSVIELYSGKYEDPEKSKYTEQQQHKINTCNTILLKKALPPLTDKEADYMLDPEGMNQRLAVLEEEMKDIMKLQRLAGFRVESKIVKID